MRKHGVAVVRTRDGQRWPARVKACCNSCSFCITFVDPEREARLPLVARPTNIGVRRTNPAEGRNHAMASLQRLRCVSLASVEPSLTTARIREQVDHSPTRCAPWVGNIHRRCVPCGRGLDTGSSQAVGGPRAGNARSRKHTLGPSRSSERTVDDSGSTVDEDEHRCARSVSSR